MTKILMDRVPNQPRRPGPEEELALNKPNTRYYPGSNLGMLNMARKNVGYLEEFQEPDRQ